MFFLADMIDTIGITVVVLAGIAGFIFAWPQFMASYKKARAERDERAAQKKQK